MTGMVLGFFIWFAVGASFIGLGIYAFVSKKEVAFGFWSNAEVFPVDDVKAYNRAVGKLWCLFGIVFIVLGWPLLEGPNTALILLSVLGIMLESIIAMVVYVTVIEKKYRRK